MQLFKSKPSLIDGEKARIELHLQQISQTVGADRFKLPIREEAEILWAGDAAGKSAPTTSTASRLLSADQVAHFLSQHLKHDIEGLTLKSQPQTLEKCGGGG
jgi:myo-inositol-hexaphosphate 3-phosphohydrolase